MDYANISKFQDKDMSRCINPDGNLTGWEWAHGGGRHLFSSGNISSFSLYSTFQYMHMKSIASALYMYVLVINVNKSLDTRTQI